MTEIHTLSIESDIPDTTVARERSRSPATMAVHDLLQCFAGDVRFTDGDAGNSVTTFVDVPLIRFAVDFADALKKLSDRHSDAKIIDFYGEFEIELTLKSEHIQISETVSGAKCQLPLAELHRATREWLAQIQKELLDKLPELADNSDFRRIMEIAVAT